MRNVPLKTTMSQKRAKQLSQQSDRTAKIFNAANFYDNHHLNIEKLKQKIRDAKKRLHSISHQTQEKQDRLQSFQHQNTKRCFSRVTQKASKSRSKKLITELNSFEIPRKKSYQLSMKQSREEQLESLKNNKMLILDPSYQQTHSIQSLDFNPVKKLLKNKAEVHEFELKIKILWNLYEQLVGLMQNTAKNQMSEVSIQNYIKQVTTHKFEFIHWLCEDIQDGRLRKSIKVSRVLENLSVFQLCLSLLEKRRNRQSEIVNYLGYSSSSVIFIIKVLVLSYQTIELSDSTMSILRSIFQFQQQSYKCQLRSLKEVFRRLQHNNQIIGMLKMKCGAKHGKYCEEFIQQTVRMMTDKELPFYQCSNNIFEFLAFYLHNEHFESRLPKLAMPPSPYLSLMYPKTIIIEPWGVLVYRKNEKLVIRAHTSKLLSEISKKSNIIFWSELMPKQADILSEIFPSQRNIYWLYRYHCEQKNNNLVKIPQMCGCLAENTIVIEADEQNCEISRENLIVMKWKGEKKDVKLLRLAEILLGIYEASEKNRTNLSIEAQKHRLVIEELENKKINRAGHRKLKTG